MIVCDVKANKKLPPHCMLACVREGKIVKMPDTASASPGHAVPYKLARQTLVFNRDDLSVSPPPAVSVSALLEKTKAKTLAEHNEQLKPASNKAFVATDTRTQEAHRETQINRVDDMRHMQTLTVTQQQQQQQQ